MKTVAILLFVVVAFEVREPSRCSVAQGGGCRTARLAQRRRVATGLSARPHRPWTISRSSPLPRMLAAARMAPQCSSPFNAVVAAPNSWFQDRPSPAAARNMPYPIASMMVSPCSLAGSPSSGTGAAFTGDVVRLLQSLPEDGELAVRLTTRTGATQDGSFLLGGLKMVREKLAVPCKWPNAVATPRN